MDEAHWDVQIAGMECHTHKIVSNAARELVAAFSMTCLFAFKVFGQKVKHPPFPNVKCFDTSLEMQKKYIPFNKFVFRQEKVDLFGKRMYTVWLV